MVPFTGIANPEQLAVMTEAFEGHCLQHNIVDKHARTDTAQVVILLFEGGATTVEELKARLEKQMVDEVWDPAMDAVVASPKEHAVIFENENIRVLRVAVDGGSGGPNHHHRWPSVFVFDELPGCPIADYNAAGDKIGEFDLGDAPKVLIFPPQPTHRVENTGSKPIRGIRVEFKNGQLKSGHRPEMIWGMLSP